MQPCEPPDYCDDCLDSVEFTNAPITLHQMDLNQRWALHDDAGAMIELLTVRSSRNEQWWRGLEVNDIARAVAQFDASIEQATRMQSLSRMFDPQSN